MKKYTGFQKAALPIAAALILILVASGPAAFGGFEEPLTLLGHTINGSQVLVDVSNSSSDPETGEVWVEAKVNGETVYGFAPVTVMGKQTTTVAVGFSSAVESVTATSLVTDEGNPF